jgi:hypothetical protein
MGNVPIGEAEARRLIAGAIRFSRRNEFKLPHKYERFAAAAGVSPADADAADLSDFGGPGGKLRYVGSIGTLRQKLIGPVDDFLARGDVEFVMGPDSMASFDDDYKDADDQDEDHDVEDAFDDETGEPPEELRQAINLIADRAESAVRQWLSDGGRDPHPRLSDAVDVVLAAAMLEWTAQEAFENRDELPDLKALLSNYDEPELVAEAVSQVIEFVKRYESPQRFIEAMGMPEEEEDERAAESSGTTP